MPAIESIRLDDPETARAVLGRLDCHLRRVREALGVSAVFRGGKLAVKGRSNEVRRAVSALEEMRRLAESRGLLTDEDVARILGQERRLQRSPLAASQPRPLETRFLTERLVVGRGREVETRTAGQSHYVRAMRADEITFCVGPAGTGKTYLAVADALSSLERGEVTRIALARPAVEAGERLGFLPGDERQKVNPYLRPLYDALTDMMSYADLGRLIDRGVVEIVPLAFMRGRTLSRSCVILDEAQNTTSGQMLMFLTRLGPASRAVVTGDITQIDLPDPSDSGLVQACRILDGVKGIGIVHLSEKDIVRHRLVRSVIAAYAAASAGGSDGESNKDAQDSQDD